MALEEKVLRWAVREIEDDEHFDLQVGGAFALTPRY